MVIGDLVSADDEDSPGVGDLVDVAEDEVEEEEDDVDSALVDVSVEVEVCSVEVEADADVDLAEVTEYSEQASEGSRLSLASTSIAVLR